MKRGEVWWARLPGPAGKRPVVLVSREAAYDVKLSVTVIEVSTTVRGIDSEVPLGVRDGLPKKCVANADNVVTIPKTWLAERLCALRADKLRAVDRALAFSLGLPSTTGA